MSIKIGGEYETRTPTRNSEQEWEVQIKSCIVVEEVPLCTGNQPLYVIQSEDGSMGKAWEKMLHPRSEQCSVN